MAAQVQNSLFDISLYLVGKPKKKRVRYKKPTYVKSYTFTHTNPYTGELEYDGDEKHIFRIRNLHNIHSLLYGYCDINIFEQFEKKEYKGLTIWGEDRQAEITGTNKLPIQVRLLLHLRLLRYLRKGFSIEESLERLKYENME